MWLASSQHGYVVGFEVLPAVKRKRPGSEPLGTKILKMYMQRLRKANRL